MSEAVDWGADGVPRSARYGDIYRSTTSGLDQAQQVFMGGCGLPAGWAAQARYCILETGFGLGLNFLAAWHAWRCDPQRPRMLHFASVEAHPVHAADLLRSAEAFAPLRPLAKQLAEQWWGLTHGWHRLSFEGGQLLLTLGIGDACTRLREQSFAADAVFLDGFDPQRNPRMWDDETLQAVARRCRTGSTLATWCVAAPVRAALERCGFELERLPGLAPKRHRLQGRFVQPAQVDGTALHVPVTREASDAEARAVVIGAGIAGASVAAALARRGWKVQVLDAADAPATGASGLPAGLFAPHVSPDDAPLSRLTRAGVRATRQALAQHLPHLRGTAWLASGVLERPIDRVRQLPRSATADGDSHGDTEAEAWRDFSREANPDDYARLHDDALRAAEDGALWHACGGWLQPARLVRALLAQPGVHWRAGTPVARLQATPSGLWQALDAHGSVLAEAEQVVVAAAHATQALCASASGAPSLPLQPLRGQVTMGAMPRGGDAAAQAASAPGGLDAAWPEMPVNGQGSLLAGIPLPGIDGPGWLVGSTFDRGRTDTPVEAAGHRANLQRLHALAPGLAARHGEAAIGAEAAVDALHGWAGVRATLPDRLPALGALKAGLWVAAGFGSRGLTLAPLAAEVMCAWLHREPMPLDDALAARLAAQRFAR